MNTNFFAAWNPYFSKYRPFLISFAFRMTGSLAEAEDLVQESFVECADVNPATIENHKSWLTKICSNKGIDLLRSAPKRREAYHGTWLPDAVPDSLQVWGSLNQTESPDKNLVLAESLTTSFLILIDRLSPEERVAYLLSEVFDYSFKDIAAFLDKSEAACRKIAQRARDSILSSDLKFSKPKPNSEKLILDFFESAKRGDEKSMISLLADGSEFWADGGGKVSASAVILRDATKIAHFFAKISTSKVFHSVEFKFETCQVSSRPGYIISKKLADGTWEFESVMSFEFKDDKIARIYSQRNPDKLKSLLQVN